MATITARTGTRSWGTATDWEGDAKPVPLDRVVIPFGCVMTLNENADIGDDPADTTTLVLTVSGTLKFDTAAASDLTLTVRGNISIGSTSGHSYLYIGNSDVDPVPAARKFTLDLSQGNGNWWIYLYGDVLTNSSSHGHLYTYGAAAYHMASASMQRTTLAANATAGTDVTIQFTDSVDYSANDYVWLAKGGDRTVELYTTAGAPIGGTNYGLEKVLLKTKSSATTYTADLTYDHKANDMVVHGERNAIIKGASAKGFSIIINNSTGDRAKPEFHLNWTALVYAVEPTANAAIKINLGNFASYALTGTDFELKNTIFDSVAGGTQPYGVLFNAGTKCRMTARGFDEAHFWGYTRTIYITALPGRKIFGHLSSLNNPVGASTNYAGGIQDAFGYIDATGLWFCGQSPLLNTRALYARTGFKLGYIKSHTAYTALWHLGAGSYVSVPENSVGSGEIYHCQQYGILVTGHANVFRNLKIADTTAPGVYTGSGDPTEAIWVSCEFDDLNRGSPSADGAIIVSGSSRSRSVWRFIKCKFGETVRNYCGNIECGAGSASKNGWVRVLLEDCESKQPQGVPYAQTEFTAAMKYAIAFGGASWTKEDRMGINRGFSAEFVRHKTHDSGGTDIWTSTYGVNWLAVVGGGGEVWAESTVVRDGSYAIAIRPYAYYGENAGCRTHPIAIPALSGQTVTVSLYLRKNHAITEAAMRPGIHLRGLGILDDAAMTDVTDTWEQLTVSGEALADGFVEFWVDGGRNAKVVNGNIWDPEALAHILIYADELAITVA